jgi:hypothetical protein
VCALWHQLPLPHIPSACRPTIHFFILDTAGFLERARMLQVLPFSCHSQLSCDCVAVQPAPPHIVAVASYELLSSEPAAGSDSTSAGSGKVGVGGQMRTGAIDFFEEDGEALRLLHHWPCAAGTGRRPQQQCCLS